MDDDEARRLAKLIAEELAPLLNQPHHRYRLSQQALEQRRAASRSAVEKRSAPRRRKKIPVPDPGPEVVGRSVASENPAPKSTEKVTHSRVTADVWTAYFTAYKLRYSTFPVRNAKVNGMLAQFVKRLPREEAPLVAAFYVKSENPLYVRSRHCVELLVRDAEGLRMEWATGRSDVQRVNGSHVTTVSKPWWEVWSALEQQGDDLGIERDANPTTYRFEVLRAAFVAGRLPADVATKLGVNPGATEE